MSRFDTLPWRPARPMIVTRENSREAGEAAGPPDAIAMLKISPAFPKVFGVRCNFSQLDGACAAGPDRRPARATAALNLTRQPLVLSDGRARATAPDDEGSRHAASVKQ